MHAYNIDAIDTGTKKNFYYIFLFLRNKFQLFSKWKKFVKKKLASYF